MKNRFLQTSFIAASLLIAGYAGQSLAHSTDGVLDPNGNNASATNFWQLICYDDGNGAPHHLYTQIQDNSPPVPGLLLSTQIFTANAMANTTDTVSADGQGSNPASLYGGAPTGGAQIYYISVSKTKAGSRSFSLIYHCQTANDTHTGTDITAYQAQ
jgi:hypothetical protein